MKHSATCTTLFCILGLAMSAAYADDSSTGTKSTNAATPAVTNGPGQAATPAMPGNPTAQEKVTANRAKEQALRDAAAKRRADATANGTTRPDAARPDISRPEIHR